MKKSISPPQTLPYKVKVRKENPCFSGYYSFPFILMKSPPFSMYLNTLFPYPASKSAGIMRMSCNGCRVLRKGCSEDCIIRPCLQWINSPDFQANATLFLAKFYGRAGLINLINAAPQNCRPAIFKSLLYEACGRIVNPIYGSVGLLWSGNWGLWQAAVEAVLKGSPIMPVCNSDAAKSEPNPALKPYDIRHNLSYNAAGSKDLRKVRSPARFKRCLNNLKPQVDLEELNWVGNGGNGETRGEIMEDSEWKRAMLGPILKVDSETEEKDGEIKLDLALGLEQ